MNLTNRQKAILVGLLIGDRGKITLAEGQYDFNDGVGEYLPDAYFDAWLGQELAGVQWDANEVQTWLGEAWYQFYSELDSQEVKRLEVASEPIPPSVWVNKMSPLALAVMYRCTAIKPSIICTSDIECDTLLIESIKNKWGINFVIDKNLQTMSVASEEDAINWWLLLKKHLIVFAPDLIPTLEARYRRNGKQIYLSGPQEKVADNGVGWRVKVSPILFKMGFFPYSPPYEEGRASDRFGVNFKQLKEENFEQFCELGSHFVDKDRCAVLESDITLAYYDPRILSAGTISEICMCHEFNKEIFVVIPSDVKPQDLPLWVLGSIKNPHRIYNGFEEAIKDINAIFGER